MARFEGTLKNHLKNAFMLSLGSPVTTVIITAVNVAPVLLFLFRIKWFFRVIPIIALLWTGAAAHLHSWLLLRLFDNLQPEKGEKEDAQKVGVSAQEESS